jgi:hypothetical protein
MPAIAVGVLPDYGREHSLLRDYRRSSEGPYDAPAMKAVTT